MKNVATWLMLLVTAQVIQNHITRPTPLDMEKFASLEGSDYQDYIASVRDTSAAQRVLENQALNFALDRTNNIEFAREFSNSIMRVSRDRNVDPRFIMSIMSVENAPLDTDVKNWYGAVGLMQVVEELHIGEYPECGTDLTDVYTNICYGVNIFEYKLERCKQNMQCALWNYNGCTVERRESGENCIHYPSRVQQHYAQMTEE